MVRKRYRCLGSKLGRAVFINECHGLRKDAIRQLLVVLERIPKHVVWMFTTTNAGQQLLCDGIDAAPLVSRCVPYPLDVLQCLPLFAARAMAIAEMEGLGGAHAFEYLELAKRCKGNFRAILSQIEAGVMYRHEQNA